MCILVGHAAFGHMSNLLAVGTKLQVRVVIRDFLKVGLAAFNSMSTSSTEGAGYYLLVPYGNVPYAVLSDVSSLFARCAVRGRGRR